MIKNAKTIILIAGILAAGLCIGCGGKKGGRGAKTPQKDADGNIILTQEARKDFAKTATEFETLAKEGWTEANCDKMTRHFEKVAKEHGMPEASYNIGVVYEKCGKPDKAKDAFKNTMKDFPDNIPTKQLSLSHLALMDIRAGNDGDAEVKLKQAVGLGRNTMEAVPAYTMAATLLTEKAKSGDKEAWAKSQKALRTALAIDAKFMPALYQLTMLYFEIAVTLDKPSYLTLASLVFDQAVKTDPEFAPIYHALGRILLHKNELVEALKAFERAFQKDPKLFEAYMSFAAINLNFRGYTAAKSAFEKAIALQPNSYDAHMGLGVAARGLGDYALARAEYKKSMEIDKSRTDYIFNLGLLEMDYENDGTPAGFAKAQKVFETFIPKATAAHKVKPKGKNAQSWVDKAETRIATCKKAIKDIKQAEKEMAELQKLQAEQAKAQKELEEQQKRAAELAAKEAEGAQAKAEDVDEKALEAEIAAEEKAASEKAAQDKKAKEDKEKAKEDAEAADKEAKKAEKKEKGKVDLN